jgi:hypothetical protein
MALMEVQGVALSHWMALFMDSMEAIVERH